MVQLGIGFLKTTDIYPTDNKIGWVLVEGSGTMSNWHNPSYVKNIVWENEWEDSRTKIHEDRAWYSDVNVIKSRFDMATKYKDKPWTHGTYLFMDETYSPAVMVGWGWSQLSKWNIEGSVMLPNGVLLRGLKEWYISKYGSWNSSWWASVVTNNIYRDPVLLDWNFNEWVYKVYNAWNDHLHSLGKFTCHVGFANVDPAKANLTAITWNWGSQLSMVGTRTDAILMYHFPLTVASAKEGLTVINFVRPIVKNKLIWLLITQWTNSGTNNINVQFEDYKTGIAGNADVIMMTAWSDMRYNPVPTLPSEPRLISFCTQTGTCPSLLPPCIPNWQCEMPLNGYESDGCGNRRPNAACNIPKKYKCSGAPFYQCSEDPNGEFDTLVACNTSCATQRPSLSSIIITPGTATMLVGDSLIVVGTAIDSQGATMGGIPIVWTSDPAGIVEIDPVNTATFIDGKISTKVKGISPGMVMIKGTSGSISGQLILDVNVAPPLPPPPPPPPVEPPVQRNDEKVVLAVIAALSFLR